LLGAGLLRCLLRDLVCECPNSRYNPDVLSRIVVLVGVAGALLLVLGCGPTTGSTPAASVSRENVLPAPTIAATFILIPKPTKTPQPPLTATRAPTDAEVPTATGTPSPTATGTATQSPTPSPTVEASATLTLAPAREPEPLTSGLPHFEPVECAFQLPPDREVTCGYVVVPEDRSAECGSEHAVWLHVAIIHSTSETPEPDPIVYLGGGPGGYVSAYAFVIARMFDSINRSRDVIVFDQRGVGLSQPSLDCPEVDAYVLEMLDQNPTLEEERRKSREVYQACHDRLVEQGINLSAYNSAENAADLDDIRRALGYDEWNLYGVSYGTRLALTAMRDHSEGIRSVVLDSAVPLQADLLAEIGPNAERAMDLLFERCGADAACDSAYPELETVFFDLVARLNASPITFRVEPYDVLLDGDDLIGVLRQLLYISDVIPDLPKMVYDIDQQQYDDLAYWLGFLIFDSETFSEGMYASVQCAEEVPFHASGEAEAVLDSIDPRLRDYFTASLDDYADLCDTWDIQPANLTENEAVVSDIPTLVLSGDYDPITPPEWGQRAAAGLENVFYVEFSGLGHGVFGDRSCAREIVEAFLVSPVVEPDISCASDFEIVFTSP
jgi:pimeloyl-ACP methyl ester carboxylesterase